LNGFIPEFQSDYIKCYGNKHADKGVFGLVMINKMNVLCAKKTITGSLCDLKSEACVMLQLSGHPCFPFFYGIMKPGALLMEYISPCSNAVLPSRSLHSILGSRI